MAHLHNQKKKILSRISRIQGQLDAVARELNEEKECGLVLQTLAASKGALNGLMCEILEDHIRSHVMDKKNEQPTLELIDVLKSYLK